ncbi:hypothetical protein AWM75_01485 [Aerococcus urinaehominis]|uniref:Citrate transporter-like domain-containing protein n=1 Tax=Aerococcus urinaehominis TaxID=128944 RepID=A0A0X8FK22_9LACT|nr:SLC13 family permease [Aerococcus urinaehominis]AMB98747.1 hypothetical protein AWM75_01485 [Aerococcus urinaehominis]SDM14295.1 Na+/H+ antiporter NhaD [Aerococcus urinaehominis]
MEQLILFIRKHSMVILSLSLALLSVIVGRFDWRFINYGVIVTLFGLMLVLGIFAESGLLKQASIFLVTKSANSRRLVQALILVAFLGSFLLPNDIAVLTLLPIYLQLLGYLPRFKGRVLSAALIVVAANLGGVFFPFSNPQNLVIYSHYGINFFEFMMWTLPLMLAGLFGVMVLSLLVAKAPISTQLSSQPVNYRLVIWASIGMLIMVAAVFGLINVYWASLGIAVFVLLFRPHFLRHVDYLLLLTFASFFIVVGNLSELTVVQDWLASNVNQKQTTYLAGVGLSQVISNVPTSILIAPFTEWPRQLLLGVNIGGLGSLVASLANLIGYNIIKPSLAIKTNHYLKVFLLVNLLLLVFLTLLFYPY